MTNQAVLFDLDGVIADSEPLHQAAFRATLAKYGYDLTDRQYNQYFMGKTDQAGLEGYLAALGRVEDIAGIIKDKVQTYLELASSRLRPYLGVIELIQALTDEGLGLGLVTGSSRLETQAMLDAFALAKLFGVVVAAEDTAQGKPSPEGYLKAAGYLRISPANCVVIEDSPTGIKAAKAAGMSCLAVTNTYFEADLAQADLIVDRLRLNELHSLLKH